MQPILNSSDVCVIGYISTRKDKLNLELLSALLPERSTSMYKIVFLDLVHGLRTVYKIKMIIMFCDLTKTNNKQIIMHPEINMWLLPNFQ